MDSNQIDPIILIVVVIVALAVGLICVALPPFIVAHKFGCSGNTRWSCWLYVLTLCEIGLMILSSPCRCSLPKHCAFVCLLAGGLLPCLPCHAPRHGTRCRRPQTSQWRLKHQISPRTFAWASMTKPPAIDNDWPISRIQSCVPIAWIHINITAFLDEIYLGFAHEDLPTHSLSERFSL